MLKLAWLLIHNLTVYTSVCEVRRWFPTFPRMSFNLHYRAPTWGCCVRLVVFLLKVTAKTILTDREWEHTLYSKCNIVAAALYHAMVCSVLLFIKELLSLPLCDTLWYWEKPCTAKMALLKPKTFVDIQSIESFFFHLYQHSVITKWKD